jgi:uncharacterized cupredoxin-like copper-binding protein
VSFIGALRLLGSTAQGAETVKVNMKDGDLGKDITVKGEARFEIENAGTTEHAFELEGEIGGKFEVASPVLEPGGKATLIVGLPAGTYEAYCRSMITGKKAWKPRSPLGNQLQRGTM